MRLVEAHRIDLTTRLTHTFRFEDIAKAYETFFSRTGGVMKVVITVS